MKLTLEAINQAIAVLFFVCYAYQFVYTLLRFSAGESAFLPQPRIVLRCSLPPAMKKLSSAICWIACMPRITICH